MTETLELTVPVTSAVVAPSAPVDVDKLDTAKPLAEIFQPYQTTLEKWEAKAQSLVVTNINQRTEMAQARLARLELRAVRIAMDKARIGLVENLKARTSKIDGTARVIREKIESLEAILLESEEFAERYAAKIKDELKAKREAEVIPFLNCSPVLMGDLSDLSEADYSKYLADVKMLRQAKIEAAAKAEADRLAKEAADLAERECIAAENAKLKEIAAAMERQAAIEKQAYEAEVAEAKRLADIERKRIEDERHEERRKAEVERLAERKKVEAERVAAEVKARKERDAIQAKADEEARKAREERERLNAVLEVKRKAEAAEAKRVEAGRVAKEKEAKRAAAAPDKAKLVSFSAALRGLELPTLTNAQLVTDIETKRAALVWWVDAQIELL